MLPSKPHDQRSGYMHEIDGVRGIALTLVVLFHVFGNGRVSGGVDVFLVLSAFFLTRKLLGYFDNHEAGAFQPPPAKWMSRHFLGVSTRLIPSAVIVLAAVLIATWLLAPVTQYRQNLTEVLASALYFENWELIWSQLSYGAAGPEASPLQHFWSLSVQGQFFLIWPFLALAFYTLLRSRGTLFRQAFLVTTVILTLASFIWAIILVNADQPVAYFSTWTRFWELGAGALIAFLPRTLMNHSWVRESTTWVGLAMIIACGFLIDGAAGFPGLPTLWPVGASLLVLFGATRDVPGEAAARALGAPPVAYLASIAYQLYLWHWPILVFYLQTRNRDAIGWDGAIFVVASSLVLAILTERTTSAISARSLTAWNWKWAVAVPLVPLLVVTASTLGWIQLVRTQERTALEEAATLSSDHIGALALTDPEKASAIDPNVDFVPAVESAFSDLASIYSEECIQNHRNEPGMDEVLVCDVDDYGAKRTVVMTGGSMSVQWYPALRQIAEQQNWRLLVIEKDGCRLTTESDESSCREWNRRVIDVIASYEPDLVFTLGTVVSPEPGVPEEISPGMIEQVERLEQHGIDVVGIRGTPAFPFNVPECMAEKNSTAEQCSYPREQILDPGFFDGLTIELPENLRLIDLADALCETHTCAPVVGNVFVYRDHKHMTNTYAGTLAGAVSDALRDAAPALF